MQKNPDISDPAILHSNLDWLFYSALPMLSLNSKWIHAKWNKNATNSGSAGYMCSLFPFNRYNVVKELWKKFDVNLRQQHTGSETRTLSTTNVSHPQELNTFWIASGKFSGLNYLFCSSYVELLEAFLRYTSADHVDRKKLTQAIGKFKDLDTLFRQVIKNYYRLSTLYKVKKELHLSASSEMSAVSTP